MNKVSFEVFSILLASLGVLTGLYFPEAASSMSFIGDIFILLLKMIIIPLVMSSIYLSIVKLDVSEVKNLGVKTLMYYFLTSSLACCIGLVIANSFSFTSEAGIGALPHLESAPLNEISLSSFVTNFFTGNFFTSLNEGNIVQIVVFTFFLAAASLRLGKEHKKILVEFSQATQEVMMVLISWVIKIAPIGIFSLVSSIVAKTQFKLFEGLGSLFLAISIAVFIHTLIVLPSIGYFIGGFNPYSFMFKVKRAIIVALTTASSTATLPISTLVLSENVGVKPKTSGFVLPLGATLNMDGSALYQAIVILFMGEFSGLNLSLFQQALVFFFVMTSAAGTAGIPGGGIMMMGTVMGIVGIPLENIAIYLLIDRFWDYPITAVNVFGDLIGAKTVDRFIKS